jgi:lipopolysaccharide transport system ATP-binding protein
MIRVDGLSKCYRIDHFASQRGEFGYRTLRDDLMRIASAPLRRLRGVASSHSEDFWALRDIGFEVQASEVVGIIGKNGAGKSTLLKILSRITRPTTGRAELRGRIGSLLEVGTGFHPELTGRENIYLNGSILGMRRREINRRFDEIVAFAEVERFLDTPVKRYSSGMYVRLAFAVAAHLEPEVLIVDEVLAVGDQNFQKKCLGKMSDVGRSGRTVLFVSHNMAAVEALCHRCVLLDSGRLVMEGETAAIVNRYVTMGSNRTSGHIDLSSHQGRTKKSIRIMRTVSLCDGTEGIVSTVKMGSPLSVKVEFDCGGKTIKPVLGVVVKTVIGAALFGVNNRFIPNFEFEDCRSGGIISCNFDALPLMPGNYTLDLYFGDDVQDLDIVMDAISFDVIESDTFGSGKIPPRAAGPIFWPATWEINHAQSV